MAVSGRKTKQFEQGSAEAYDHSCDPCSLEGQHVEAHGYCVECQDYLCIACFRSHSKSRASRHHELLDKSAPVPRIVAKSSPDICTEKCPKHGQEIIKFFCPEHEALGCNDCIILNHRTCEIDYIPEKCTGFATSNESKGTLEELHNLLKNITYVRKMADTKINEVDQAQRKVVEDIDKFQKDINDRIAELRNQIVSEVDKNRQTKKGKLSKVMKTCENVEADVKHIQQEAKNSITAKRDGQLFILIKRAKHLLKSEDIKETEAAVEEIVANYTFRRSEHVENLLRSQAVLGKVFSTRPRYTINRTIRDAVIARSKNRDMKVCVAIDIGSTHTGYGSCFVDDPLRISVPNWISGEVALMANKVPTAVLIKPDHSLCAFGFEAIQEYTELVDEGRHEQYYLFKSFMTALYQHTDAKDSSVQDVTGKEMTAVKVLSLLIVYIKDHVMKEMEKQRLTVWRTDDFHWTVAVPERFASAKQVMEEAGKQAGIASQNLTVVFESEASFTYIQTLTVKNFGGSPKISVAQFPKGTKYLVLDAGGKQVTSTIYEVGSGTSRQLLHSAFDSSGGCSVNEEYEKFLSELFGNDLLQQFKTKYIEEFEEMMLHFENRKRSVSPSEGVEETIRIPVLFAQFIKDSTGLTVKDIINGRPLPGKVTLITDKLRIDGALFKSFFKKSINTVVDYLSFILQDESALGCNTIVMVGGFSESKMMSDGVKKAFPRVQVMIPEEAGLAVIKGAVMLGHSL